jgi:hypothetical protein
MNEVALAAAAGAAITGCGLLLLQPAEVARVALRFPPDLRADQVETLLTAVAGLPARSGVVSEVEGMNGRLSFALEARETDLRALTAGLQGFAPGVRVTDLDAEALPRPTLRAWIGWRGTHVLLRRDQVELAVAALLGVLRQATRTERVRLRLRLRPVVRPKAPPLRRDADRRSVGRLLAPVEPLPSDQLRQIRNQYAGALLNVRIELLVSAGSVRRARQLMSHVVSSLRGRSGARGRLSVRSHRFALPGFGTMLAPPELVALLGFPLEGLDVPGLDYVRSPQRLPDEAIPRRGGRLFGVSSWPGLEQRELHQPVAGIRTHTLILGASGGGKSSLLTNLMLDDAAAGRGLAVLDMKGDTVVDLCERLNPERHDDVVILDPSDARPVPGLKTLGAMSPDMAADLWVGLFRRLFPDSFGVRSERYLRLGIQTLALDPDAAIVELPRVFHEPAMRRQLLSRSEEPQLASAWSSFERLTAGQQAEHLAPALGKVQDVVGRRVVRAVLGQRRPKMTIAEAMRTNRIVVVRLSPGALGEPTAQLLGGLVVYELFQAVLSRQALKPAARRPFSIYVDEPAVLDIGSVPLDSLYELARGLEVGITTATQSAAQLPPAVQRAVLTNAATLATFRTGRRDAQLVAGELAGIDADQVQHLGRFEIALRLGLADGQVASVATARTLPLPEPSVDVEALRDRAAASYGVAADETDAAMRERWRQPAGAGDAPIGRRRAP